MPVFSVNKGGKTPSFMGLTFQYRVIDRASIYMVYVTNRKGSWDNKEECLNTTERVIFLKLVFKLRPKC